MILNLLFPLADDSKMLLTKIVIIIIVIIVIIIIIIIIILRITERARTQLQRRADEPATAGGITT